MNSNRIAAFRNSYLRASNSATRSSWAYLPTNDAETRQIYNMAYAAAVELITRRLQVRSVSSHDSWN